MELDRWAVEAAKNDYYTIAVGIREKCPEALGDPMVLAAVLQLEMAERILKARLDELVGEGF